MLLSTQSQRYNTGSVVTGILTFVALVGGAYMALTRLADYLDA